MLKTLGLYEDVSYRFSQWDPNDREKYIGTKEQWDEAQGVMEKILNHLEIPYKIGVGEAASYGPNSTFRLRMSTAKRIRSSQSRLTRCLPKSSAWNIRTGTAQRSIPTSFTEHPSAAMSAHWLC